MTRVERLRAAVLLLCVFYFVLVLVGLVATVKHAAGSTSVEVKRDSLIVPCKALREPSFQQKLEKAEKERERYPKAEAMGEVVETAQMLVSLCPRRN